VKSLEEEKLLENKSEIETEVSFVNGTV